MQGGDNWRRAGLLLLGFCCGVLVIALGVRIWFRGGESVLAADAITTRLGLPPGVFEWEEVPRRGQPLRAVVRDVVLLGKAGDTIAVVPRLRFALDPTALAGEGPIVLDNVQVQDARLRLLQGPDGEWNIFEVFRVQAGGEDVEVGGEEGRGVLLRDVRIADSRVVLGTREEGGPLALRTIRDLDARLPEVRFGGDEWQVQVAALNANVSNPDLRIAQFRGTFESAPRDAIRFAVQEFRTARSALTGSGTLRFTDAGPQLDGTIRAQNLDFRDLAGLDLPIPEEGQAQFALRAEPLRGARTRYTITDALLQSLDSRVSGRVTVIAGGDQPVEIGDTRLTLDPLQLATLEQLGLADSIPVTGLVRGTIASADGENLRLDLTASITPKGAPDATPSSISAQGLVALGEGTGAERVRLRDLRVSAPSVNLANFASLFPEQSDLLRGTLGGAATLSGTTSNLRIENGDLTYTVGDAAPTRLVDATGRISLDPELRYELRARAEPLALGTIAELFPALPLRTAQLSGPVAVSGTGETVRFDVDLSGPAGGIAAKGNVALGEVPRFDVQGRVRGFQASRIVTGNVPVEGPVTGTFALNGTTEDLRFDVDLAQQSGRFALEGRLRRGEGPPQIEVGGQVTNFNLGALVGRPGLFASPLTGRVDVSGGGRQAYRFDVDLRGEAGLLDLEGRYAPGDVPSYSVVGAVAGLNLRRLTGNDALPASDLTARVDLEGQGTTLETLSGRLNLVAGPSTIAGYPLDQALARVAVRNGVLVVDTLAASLAGTRLAASGTWGLTRPAANPLNYTLVATDLSALRVFLPPPGPLEPAIAGTLTASGWVAGSLEQPIISTVVRSRGLRYGDYAADALAIDLEAAETALGWTGKATVVGDNLVLTAGQTLQALRMEAAFTPEAASFGLFARRDRQSDITAAAALDFEGRDIRGALLETLAINVGGTRWQLGNQARIRWGGIDGVAVENLVLRRSGDEEGWIAVDGRLPPTGTADLRVRAAGVDLGEVRRIAGVGPDIKGVVALEAVLEGPVDSPELQIQAQVNNLVYSGVTADLVTLNAQYAARRMVTNAAIRLGNDEVATATATLPVELSFAGGLVPSFRLLETEPLQGRIVADSLPVALLAASFPGLREGEGIIRADAAITGTPERPLVSGGASIWNGALTIDALGARYNDIRGNIALDGRRVRIDSLFVRNEGTALITGTVLLDNLTTPNLALEAVFNDFQAIDRKDLGAMELTGRLALRGSLPEPVLTGRVVLSDGYIVIPEFAEGRTIDVVAADIGDLGVDTLGAAPSPALALLEGLRVQGLQIIVGDGVWLRSPDANIQLGGSITASRVGQDTRVTGVLETVRGTYTLRAGPVRRDFDIVRGEVRFFGTDLNPRIDILAENEVRTFQGGQSGVLPIQVQLSGTLQSPRVTLTTATRPPLPESEILNYLVFGRSSAELGAAGDIAQQLVLQEAVGAVFLAPVGEQIRETLNADYLRIGAGPLGGGSALGGVGATLLATTIEIGWELREQWFLVLTFFDVGGLLFGNVAPAVGLAADYQIDDQTSLRIAVEPVRRDRLFQLGTLDQGFLYGETLYQGSVQLRRRWEYGRPREPQPIQVPPRRQVAVPPDTTLPEPEPEQP